jgi:FG-GAP-like repeat
MSPFHLEIFLSHLPYLRAAILVAAITAASAHAGAVSPVFVGTGISMDNIAGWADVPEEPSVVIATGDFNGDGVADMVKATMADGEDFGQHFLTIQLGKEDGTFINVASHNPVGKDPRALVVGDFNGDGKLDVIVGDDDGSLLEFLGDGKGNLVDAGNIATLGSVASIATGDFSHDGHLDLVVSDFRSNSAAILRGAGNGSFRLTWSFELPRRGTQFHIATADFNGDGIIDLVITSEDDNNYEVMLGNGNGTFTYAPELSHTRDPNSYCPS